VSLTGCVDEEFLDQLVLRGLLLKRNRVIELELFEALVDQGYTFRVPGLGARGFHDRVCNFHVRQGVQHRYFFVEDIVVVDHKSALTSEDVWDERVIFV